MISFLGTVETGLFGLFLFLFRTSLTLYSVGDYTLRVTILKQKFSKIINSRLQQGSRGANSVATISECADEIYFVLARSERIPFGVKTCESLLLVDRCHESVVGAAFDKDV